MNSKVSAHITQWCARIIFLIMIVLLFTLPDLVRWYNTFRELSLNGGNAIIAGFYCCAPVVFYALWCIERLIGNIRKDAVFVSGNVSCLRRLRWCCALVSFICLPAAYYYQPLIFMSVIMAFLAVAVSVMKNVMAAAVELREENDLTI